MTLLLLGLILALQMITLGVILQRQHLTVSLPDVQPIPSAGAPPSGKSAVLKLCDNYGLERHEINTQEPVPDTYDYGGVTYQRTTSFRSGMNIYRPKRA